MPGPERWPVGCEPCPQLTCPDRLDNANPNLVKIGRAALREYLNCWQDHSTHLPAYAEADDTADKAAWADQHHGVFGPGIEGVARRWRNLPQNKFRLSRATHEWVERTFGSLPTPPIEQMRADIKRDG